MRDRMRALTTRTVPNSIHQVAAEINVQDNRVIPKVIPNIAVRARKISRGLAPSARIRLLARDIGGNGAASKLPHADTRITPLHGHDAASILVVIRAKGAVCALDTAACVAVLGGIAVGLKGFVRLLPLYAHGAAAGGVKRHLVSVGGFVRCLHDIDLAVLGPVGWISEPESGPGAAAKRSVADVKDEETVVVGVFGFYSHREATRRSIGVAARADRGVDSKDGSILGCKSQVLRHVNNISCL